MTKIWLITGSSRGFGRELAQAVVGGSRSSSKRPAAQCTSGIRADRPGCRL